jgi:hypothetical protein
MKPFVLIAATLAALLSATLAHACDEHRRKPVECTSETSITGTTRTVCR